MPLICQLRALDVTRIQLEYTATSYINSSHERGNGRLTPASVEHITADVFDMWVGAKVEYQLWAPIRPLAIVSICSHQESRRTRSQVLSAIAAAVSKRT
jgi:hypothetical protein